MAMALSWVSATGFDKYIVDGLVNLAAAGQSGRHQRSSPV